MGADWKFFTLNYPSLMKHKSENLRNKQNQLEFHLISKHCSNSLSSIVSTLFTCALAFTILQVSSSDLHKYKKWLQKILCFLEELNIKKLKNIID